MKSTINIDVLNIWEKNLLLQWKICQIQQPCIKASCLMIFSQQKSPTAQHMFWQSHLLCHKIGKKYVLVTMLVLLVLMVYNVFMLATAGISLLVSSISCWFLPFLCWLLSFPWWLLSFLCWLLSFLCWLLSYSIIPHFMIYQKGVAETERLFLLSVILWVIWSSLYVFRSFYLLCSWLLLASCGATSNEVFIFDLHDLSCRWWMVD